MKRSSECRTPPLRFVGRKNAAIVRKYIRVCLMKKVKFMTTLFYPAKVNLYTNRRQ